MLQSFIKTDSGPYSPAILRFRISFPSLYPYIAPIITFSTDIFHPLLTPLTTATFSSIPSDGDPNGAAMQDRLPAGAFSLRHGFPMWYTHGSKALDNSAAPPKSPTASSTAALETLSSPSSNEAARKPLDPTKIHVVDILRYLRSAFESATTLDSVPFEAAGNPGAWYAWRAYRQKQTEKDQQAAEGTPKHARASSRSNVSHNRTPSKPGATHTRTPSKGGASGHGRTPSKGTPRAGSETPGRPKKPSEWNWDGVWEQRVKRGIGETVSESALFGPGGGQMKEDEIQFGNLTAEEISQLQDEMAKVVGIGDEGV